MKYVNLMTLLTNAQTSMAYKIRITATLFPKFIPVKMVGNALYLITYGFDCTTILGGMRYLIKMHVHLIGRMVSGTYWYKRVSSSTIGS